MKNYREQEYRELGLKVRWLDKRRAKNAYDFALRFGSKQRYGLNEETVSNIEIHKIESLSVAAHWLRARLSATGTVQIVLGPTEVCIADTEEFLSYWQDMFYPGRDDVFILHNLSNTIVMYCHEEELELGKRVV